MSLDHLRVAVLACLAIVTVACSSATPAPTDAHDEDATGVTVFDVANDTCPSPLTSCSGLCTGVDSDRTNCGGCGNVCQGATACVNGHCTLLCPSPQTACGTYCASLGTDNANCGACGVTCPAGQSCSMGHCSVGCLPGQTPCGGMCANVQSDNANCGACGVVCPSAQSCAGGHCTATCTGSQLFCSGMCTNSLTDNANCGACGVLCAPGQSCSAGHCTGTCTASQVLCSGVCANIQTDNANCGACDSTCPAGTACAAGHCEVSCGPTLTHCGSSCVNTQSDPANCGACGTACAAGQICSSGHCGLTCGAGLSLCGAMCASTQYDPANCGSCGNVCASVTNATGICIAGSCTTTCLAGFADCDGNAVNGCEVDLRTDARNCGSCRSVCSLSNVTTFTCSGGSCGIGACYSGYSNCDGMASNGCEVATYFDTRNCGGCGIVCALPNVAGHYCSGTTCQVSSCNTNFGNCDSVNSNGCETDLTTSLANCGACGRACALPNATSSACTGSACVLGTCNTGYGNCDGIGSNGCEVNLRRSNANCGACGTICGSGTACVSGACVTATACIAPTAPRVLFFGPSGTLEQTYLPTGSVVTIATDATWRTMTTTDFGTYQLIIFGANPTTAGLQTLFDTRTTWGPAITGRVVVDGYDAANHSTNTASQTYLRNTFAWLTTGLGPALYAASDSGYRALDYLSWLGGFVSTYSGYGTTRLLQPGHPIMAGLTEIVLSNWYWRSAMTAVPSTFDVVATNLYFGTVAYPVIVARDVACSAP